MFVIQHQIGFDWADDGQAEMSAPRMAKVFGVKTAEEAKEKLMDRVFASVDDDMPITLKILAVVDYGNVYVFAGVEVSA